MKHIRINELTLAKTVPQLVTSRTSDLQLAHKWTHCVHTALAGLATVGTSHALIHICRKRQRWLCVRQREGGKTTGGARIWCGGELADGRVSCIILPLCSGSPSVTEIELSELATDGQQQNFKWKVSLMCKNLWQNRKLQVFAFAYMKTI